MTEKLPQTKREWLNLLRDNITAFNGKIKHWRTQHPREVLDLSIRPEDSMSTYNQMKSYLDTLPPQDLHNAPQIRAALNKAIPSLEKNATWNGEQASHGYREALNKDFPQREGEIDGRVYDVLSAAQAQLSSIDIGADQWNPTLRKMKDGAIVTDLRNADLRGVNLSGHDFSTKISITEISKYTELTSAKYDDYTVWPEGFNNPEKAGAIKFNHSANPPREHIPDPFRQDVLAILQQANVAYAEQLATKIRDLLPPMFKYQTKERALS